MLHEQHRQTYPRRAAIKFRNTLFPELTKGSKDVW